MGRNTPESPGNAKKRRRTTASTAAANNAAANNAAAAASSSSTIQHSSPVPDLVPPPLSGYGDTVYASNPFDDTPPSVAASVAGGMPVGHGLPHHHHQQPHHSSAILPPHCFSGGGGSSGPHMHNVVNGGPMGVMAAGSNNVPFGPASGPMPPYGVMPSGAGGLPMGPNSGVCSSGVNGMPMGPMGPVGGPIGPMGMSPMHGAPPSVSMSSMGMNEAAQISMSGMMPPANKCTSMPASVVAASHSSRKVYPPDQPMVFNPQNPNAPPIYPCGMCHKEVHENDQAILCESGCNFWFHRMCTGLMEQAYHLLIAEVYAEWVCDRCLSSKNIPLIKFKP